MKPTCTIYLVRHGESEANRDEITGGDSPLTAKGREQAAQTKQLLNNIHFDAAYSSDSERAVDTAAIIYEQSIPPINQFAALREREFGYLEGKPSADWFEVMRAYEKKYKHLPFKERWGYEYGEGIENDKIMGERFIAALAAIGRANAGKTVLVAAHAGPIRVILMQLGFANWLTAGSFRNAGYVELCFNGQNFTLEKVVGVEDVEAPHS